MKSFSQLLTKLIAFILIVLLLVAIFVDRILPMDIRHESELFQDISLAGLVVSVVVLLFRAISAYRGKHRGDIGDRNSDE